MFGTRFRMNHEEITMPFPAMPTRIPCPNCGHRFVAQVQSIIDVGEQPELKEELLAGRLNVVRCPECGTGGLLSTPLIYHDPDKELLIALVPSEMNMSADEQEQLVGSLVNAVMNNTPAEKRKSYFFQPKTVLSYDSLFDAILEADGFSREVLEAQRARLQLVGDLADALDDEERLEQLIEEHRQELDYEFFLLLSEAIDSYRARGEADPESGVQQEVGDLIARMARLRDALLERVNPLGPTVSADADDDALIDLLLKTEQGDAWQRAVAANRPRLDYGFFQHLTGRIEAAERRREARSDDEQADKLRDLRKRLLDEIDAQNARIQRAQDRAVLLLMRLLEAEDPAAAVRENRDKIDEMLINVLSRYQMAAHEEGDEEQLAKLEAVFNAILEMLEEDLPPVERLINRLLRADYPDETSEILNQHRGLLNRELLDRIDQSLEQFGDEEQDLATRLRQIRGQIEAKITILRA
jgi:hypothetical protein